MKTKIIATAVLFAAFDLPAQLRDPTVARTPVQWVKSVNVPCFGGATSVSSTLPLDTTRAAPYCTGGFELRARVTLERPAPSPYIHINVSSTDITHAPAPWIRIYEGETEGTSIIRTLPVAANTPVTISAWTNSSDTKTDSFTLVPPSLSRIDLSPLTVLGGVENQQVQGVAHFNGPPAAANTIKLQLQAAPSAWVTPPTSAYLALNTLTIPFTVKASAVGSLTTVTVTGTSGTRTETATFTIRPPVLVASPNAAECYAPCDIQVHAQLEAPAPSGGAAIQLATLQPGIVMLSTNTAVAPAGQMTAAFRASVKAGAQPQDAVITESYAQSMISNTLVIKAPRKGDYWLTAPVFTDRNGSTITSIPDSYPVTMCTKVRACEKDGDTITLKCFSHEQTGVVLVLDYVNNSGTGRTASFPIDFQGDGPIYMRPEMSFYPQQAGVDICTQLSGLNNPGDWYEIKLTVDPNNVVDEIHDGNNSRTVKIYR